MRDGDSQQRAESVNTYVEELPMPSGDEGLMILIAHCIQDRYGQGHPGAVPCRPPPQEPQHAIGEGMRRFFE